MTANKLTVLFDYRKNLGKTRSKTKNDTNSVELHEWINNETNKRRIYDTRCLYIIKANQENIIKWGISGTTGKAGSYGRLAQYIHYYGVSSDLNPCAGVKLLYLAGNIYNPNVDLVNTAVYRKELQIKQHFHSDAITSRGFERQFLEKLDELMAIIDDPSNKSDEDKETERRTSERLEQSNITPFDKVMKIISHDTKGGKSQAKTKYKVQWSRPYVLTEKKKIDGKIVTTQKEVPFTFETANKLITYLDGAKQLEVYHILHKDSKFRD